MLTNVALDHMDVLGDTREAIAAEKLAVVQPGATVVLGEPEWQAIAEQNGAAAVVLDRARATSRSRVAAAEAFLGDPVERAPAADVELPGRLERRGERPLEIWDGAHNLAGVAYLLPRLPEREYVLVSSILADKRPELMLEALVGARGLAGGHPVVEYPLPARRGTRLPRRTVLRPCRDRRRSGRGTEPRTGPGGPRRGRPRLGLPLSS